MQLKVVSLDPGGTTGHATGLIDDGLMTIVSGQDRFTHRDLWLQLNVSKPQVLVCESFDYRRSGRGRTPAKVDLYPRELIGICNLYVQMIDRCELVMQKPSEGKSGYFNDRKLREDDLYKIARPHANDAVRHLLQWFTFGKGYQYNTRGYQSGWAR